MSEFQPRPERESHAAFDAYVSALCRLLPPQFELLVAIKSGNVVHRSDIATNASPKEKVQTFLRLFLDRGGDILKIRTYLQEKAPAFASMLPDKIPSFPRDVRGPQPDADLSSTEKAYADVLCRLLPAQLEKLIRIDIRDIVNPSELPMTSTQRKIAEALIRKYFEKNGDLSALKKLLMEKAPAYATNLP